MRLKSLNESPHEGWAFYFIHPTNGETQQVAGANSLDQLEQKVVHQFSNLKMEIPPNLRQIIEHQICLRQPNPTESCWSGGIGDDIHHKFMKPFLNKVAEMTAPSPKRSKTFLGKVGSTISRVAKSIGTCGGCGGTRVFKQGENVLGRAGQFNQVIGPSHK